MNFVHAAWLHAVALRDRASRGPPLTSILSLWPEVHGAVRLPRRQPLFTTLLVVILTLAIGSSAAMFSVLNAVVLRPLPYGSPQQLVWLWAVRPDGSRGPFSIQDVVDLRERNFGSAAFGAFASARALGAAIGGLLFDIRPGDPGPYVVVTIVLAFVGASACYVPASRAAKSDPLRVLRHD